MKTFVKITQEDIDAARSPQLADVLCITIQRELNFGALEYSLYGTEYYEVDRTKAVIEGKWTNMKISKRVHKEITQRAPVGKRVLLTTVQYG